MHMRPLPPGKVTTNIVRVFPFRISEQPRDDIVDRVHRDILTFASATQSPVHLLVKSSACSGVIV